MQELLEAGRDEEVDSLLRRNHPADALVLAGALLFHF